MTYIFLKKAKVTQQEISYGLRQFILAQSATVSHSALVECKLQKDVYQDSKSQLKTSHKRNLLHGFPLYLFLALRVTVTVLPDEHTNHDENQKHE